MNCSPSTVPTVLCCLAVALFLSRVAKKRCRSTVNDNDDDDDNIVKRQRNDVSRGELRQSVCARLMGLHDATFKKMFRMDKRSLLLLHSKIAPILDSGKTPRSAAMAKVSSRSAVTSFHHLCCTLRWLAGATPPLPPSPQRVACGVWCVVCGVWRVACGVWRVACGVWRVACGVWRVACGVWRVACGVWRVACDPSHSHVHTKVDLRGTSALACVSAIPRCMSKNMK
jgi:hypothetical protein